LFKTDATREMKSVSTDSNVRSVGIQLFNLGHDPEFVSFYPDSEV
jgi:hypothetical protein